MTMKKQKQTITWNKFPETHPTLDSNDSYLVTVVQKKWNGKPHVEIQLWVNDEKGSGMFECELNGDEVWAWAELPAPYADDK